MVGGGNGQKERSMMKTVILFEKHEIMILSFSVHFCSEIRECTRLHKFASRFQKISEGWGGPRTPLVLG